MKTLSIFTLLIPALFLQNARSANADVQHISTLDRIRAVVNGKVITQGDIDIMLANASGKRRNDAIYINKLINDILLKEKVAELEKFGIRIDQSWIDRRVRELVREGYKHSESYLRKIVEMDAISLHIKRYFIKRNISVSPDDIRDYYERHIEDFSDPAQVLIRSIAVRYFPRPDLEAGIEEIRSTLNEIQSEIADKNNSARIEELNKQIVNAEDSKYTMMSDILKLLRTFMGSEDPLLKKEAEGMHEKYKYYKTEKQAGTICRDILKELKNNEDFGTLVIKYSEGAFQNTGGKWDWFRKGGLSGKLSIIEETAFKLKDQEISSILDTGNTKYIIQKIGDKPASLRKLSDREVQEKIFQTLFKQKEHKEWVTLLTELRESAYIRVFK